MKKSRFNRYFLPFLVFAMTAPAMWAGLPIITNYLRSDYHAGPQNWAIAQAPSGAMLFGNSNGLLTFDSHSWSLRGIDNSTTLRSIAVVDSARRVYVGASNDFGYFTPDPVSGELDYHSLRNTIRSPEVVEFGEIWNIHCEEDAIWFQGDFRVFCFDGEKTNHINVTTKITASAVIGGKVYLGFVDGTVGYISGSKVSMLPGAEVLAGDRVCALLPYRDGKIMIVTSFHGLFLWDGMAISSYPSPLDRFLRDNQVFCATLSNEKVVFGTVNRGAVIHDITTQTNTFIDKESGLCNNTVLSASFDTRGNLWLGLDNGLAYVLANAPFSALLSSNAGLGAGYASLLSNGTLWLGTNQGLYSSSFSDDTSHRLRDDVRSVLKGQVWGIDTIGSTIFVSGDAGLYCGVGAENFKRIDGISGAWSVIPLKHYPGHVLASTYDGFYLLSRDGADGWQTEGKVAGYQDVGGRPVEDDNGDIWIGQWIKGVYRMHPSADYRSFERVYLYDSSHGFPSDNNNRVAKFADGRLVFVTDRGFYRFDAENDVMLPDDRLNDLLNPTGTGRIYNRSDGNAWCVTRDNVVVFNPSDYDSPVDSVSYRVLSQFGIPGFESFDFIDDNHLVVGAQEGFYDVDLRNKVDTVGMKPVYITSIYANRDSLIFSDVIFPAAENEKIELSFDLNSLLINWVQPEYRVSSSVSYSYLLEDYDADWSPYSDVTSKEYTQLHEGSYTFRVRAFNSYTGMITESEIAIRIKAPWYRSIWANTVYFLLILVALYFGYQMFNRYSRHRADRVEAEKGRELEAMKREAHEEALRKDYEIARLKSEQLEHDIRHKSGELSNITMNVIRKNEILLDIAGRLTKLQKAVKGSPDEKQVDAELDHIKTLIRENISHDDDWRNFTRNFDVVYENYMKRLLAKYPNLSASDQRVCAYLKMGLSSKEIAPLLNISYRSVEMTRYRLRKKMNLPREVNLAEYLRNF